MKALIQICVAAALLPFSMMNVYGWEATYPRGPVRSSPKPLLTLFSPHKPDLRDMQAIGYAPLVGNVKALGYQPPPSGAFDARTIAYPAEEGANLGVGWDFVTNKKKQASCVTFQEIGDTKYQNAQVGLQQSIDEETLNESLNAEFSGGGSGDIGIVSAKADATSTVNASHHLDTTDTDFVAHASITSGVKYAAPINGGVTLTSGALNLLKSDPETFREICGDGFVASIGQGADLYILLHAHDLNSDDKLELSLNVKASAGVTDVFNANGSSKLSTTLERLSNQHELDISFVQQGGVIKLIPTTLKDAQTKVATLATEETNNDIDKGEGPRSIYIKLVPYSETTNYEQYFWLDSTDPRQRAIRYAQRLTSILYETLNIRENYYRDRSNTSIKDAYFYSYYHNLRTEDLGAIQEAVYQMLNKVNDLLTVLSNPECNPTPVQAHLFIPKGASERYKRNLSALRFAQLVSLGRDAAACDAAIQQLVNLTNNFDDFSFWIRLPLPINAISPGTVAFLENSGNSVQDRIAAFAQSLYRQWVEEQDQLRCRLFFECLSLADKVAKFAEITGGLSVQTPTASTQAFKACAGEFDAGCAAGSIRFDCDHANDEADATQICETERGAFRHTALRARMIEDMRVRGFTEKTRNDYIRNVRSFAAIPSCSLIASDRLYQSSAAS